MKIKNYGTYFDCLKVDQNLINELLKELDQVDNSPKEQNEIINNIVIIYERMFLIVSKVKSDLSKLSFFNQTIEETTRKNYGGIFPND